jgi:chemotaxis protein CheD
MDARARITLGSCIGLCLFWPAEQRVALAHILLPEPKDGLSEAAHKASRYATTAPRFLLDLLGVKPGQHRKIEAYLAGGGELYSSETTAPELASARNVGPQNIMHVEQTLSSLRVRVCRRDLGGSTSRQLVLDGPGRRLFSMNLSESGGSLIWSLRQ